MNQSTTRLTAIQLQQRLIHAQAEAAKLKNELNRYKNDYHYSMIDELTAENEQLHEQLLELQQKHKAQSEELDALSDARARLLLKEEEDHSSEERSPSPQHESEKLEESTFYTSRGNMEKKQNSQPANDDDLSSTWFARSLKTRSKK